MSLNALRKGQHVQIGATEFLVLQKIPNCRWQLQNTATGQKGSMVDPAKKDLATGARQSYGFKMGQIML